MRRIPYSPVPIPVSIRQIISFFRTYTGFKVFKKAFLAGTLTVMDSAASNAAGYSMVMLHLKRRERS